jgi:hypothetical protein
MKKIFRNPFLLPLLVIVFAFTLFTAASCEDANKETLSPYKAKEKVQFNDSTFFTEIGVIDKWSTATTKVYVVKYDGCEYIMTVSYTGDSRGGVTTTVTHSASCSNPIHSLKDEEQ